MLSGIGNNRATFHFIQNKVLKYLCRSYTNVPLGETGLVSKDVVFGKSSLYSGKRLVFGKSSLYSGKRLGAVNDLV